MQQTDLKQWFKTIQKCKMQEVKKLRQARKAGSDKTRNYKCKKLNEQQTGQTQGAQGTGAQREQQDN